MFRAQKQTKMYPKHLKKFFEKDNRDFLVDLTSEIPLKVSFEIIDPSKFKIIENSKSIKFISFGF